VFTRPDETRCRFKERPEAGLVAEAAKMRPRKGSSPIVFTTNVVIRGLARCIQDLDSEMGIINDALTELINATAPSLVELHGVGVVTAAPCWSLQVTTLTSSTRNRHGRACVVRLRSRPDQGRPQDGSG
jgi:hypothetical protein